MRRGTCEPRWSFMVARSSLVTGLKRPVNWRLCYLVFTRMSKDTGDSARSVVLTLIIRATLPLSSCVISPHVDSMEGQ